MHDFTPLSSLVGGALIGLAASLLLIVSGRIAGISSIVSGLLVVDARGDRAWRIAFLAGLLVAGFAFTVLNPSAIQASPRSGVPLVLAGLLVGAGTHLASGCTSGHGVCGLSRLSVRSLAATVVFVAAGMLTVTLVRVLGGGS